MDDLGPLDWDQVEQRAARGDTSYLRSMGGMYSTGVDGAYGRLWAWRSLAGLSGTAADASADEVERHASQSTWFHFEADAEWFHNELCADYGIATLSPDRRRLAVLAATDTD